MQFKSKVKATLVLTMAFCLLIPSALSAKPLQKEEINKLPISKNESAVLVNSPQIVEERALAFVPVSIRAASSFLWTAAFEVTTNFQIPYTIYLTSSNNTLFYSARTLANTGSNPTYQIVIESFDGWSGGWLEVKRFTHNVGGTSANSVYGLSASEGYRIKIVGNVKGNIDVSRY